MHILGFLRTCRLGLLLGRLVVRLEVFPQFELPPTRLDCVTPRHKPHSLRTQQETHSTDAGVVTRRTRHSRNTEEGNLRHHLKHRRTCLRVRLQHHPDRRLERLLLNLIRTPTWHGVTGRRTERNSDEPQTDRAHHRRNRRGGRWVERERYNERRRTPERPATTHGHDELEAAQHGSVCIWIDLLLLLAVAVTHNSLTFCRAISSSVSYS